MYISSEPFLKHTHHHTVVDYLDNARDLLNFVENYLPTDRYDSSSPAPPTHLPRLSSPPTLGNRVLVALGHSIGASSLCALTPFSPMQDYD